MTSLRKGERRREGGRERVRERERGGEIAQLVKYLLCKHEGGVGVSSIYLK